MKRALLAALLTLALARPIRAQESADEAKKAAVLEEARQHVAKAKMHYDLGEFKEAADEYILVYRLRPISALLFNIAQAYRQAGLYDKAKQFYKSYLREAPDAKNKDTIEQAIREMDELLAKEKRTKAAPPTGVKQPAEASLPMMAKGAPDKSAPAKAAETNKPVEPAKPPAQPKPADASVAKVDPAAPKTELAAAAKPASPPVPGAKPGLAPSAGATTSAPPAAKPPATVAVAPSRSEPAPTAARPASTFRSPLPQMQERHRAVEVIDLHGRVGDGDRGTKGVPRVRDRYHVLESHAVAPLAPRGVRDQGPRDRRRIGEVGRAQGAGRVDARSRHCVRGELGRGYRPSRECGSQHGVDAQGVAVHCLRRELGGRDFPVRQLRRSHCAGRDRGRVHASGTRHARHALRTGGSGCARRTGVAGTLRLHGAAHEKRNERQDPDRSGACERRRICRFHQPLKRRYTAIRIRTRRARRKRWPALRPCRRARSQCAHLTSRRR